MYDKIEKTKKKLGDRVHKEAQVKNLSDIIRISLQQGRMEMAGKRVTRSTLMRERLLKLADMLVELFGGLVFIAPLDIAENAALNSASGKSGRRFLTYIWSNSAKKALLQMGSDPSSSPMLDRAPIFQYVLDSRMYYIPDLKLLSLPSNHFKMDKALILPIVVDGKSLGLVGFANGRFTNDDARVLFESLPMAWLTVISEAVKTSSSLLSNTLPAPIVERLMNNSSSRDDTARGGGAMVQSTLIADKHEDVTILFCDIVGFTSMARNKTPEKLVSFLNEFFSMIDDLADSYELEKIKTIGDCYMVAGGLPLPKKDHLERVSDFALELIQAVRDFNESEHTQIQVRVGLHCGPVVAGVIGRSKFTYDVWGDTVNFASRMESSSVSGRIHVTEEIYNRLNGSPFYSFEPRGQVKILGIGLVNSFFLESGRPVQKSTSLPRVSFDNKERAVDLVDRKTSPPPPIINNKIDMVKNNKIERAISSPVSVSEKVHAPKPKRTSNSHLPKLI